MVQRFISTAALLVFLLLVACGDEGTVTVYPLKKVYGEHSYGHEWLPLNPTTYKVGEDKVIGKTLDTLSEYQHCKILSIENWECGHSSEGLWAFGFRSGEFWERPVRDRIRYVSWLRYTLVTCEWDIQDEYDGFVWGAIRCALRWFD